MKAQSMILLAGFVLMSLYGYSQKNVAPQKGYYSIKGNTVKLKAAKTAIANYTKAEVAQPGDSQVITTTKGYYAIGNNKHKAPEASAVLIKTTADTVFPREVRPVITKGYYSIGRNAEKLQ